jgi:hypothetical protein
MGELELLVTSSCDIKFEFQASDAVHHIFLFRSSIDAGLSATALGARLVPRISAPPSSKMASRASTQLCPVWSIAASTKVKPTGPYFTMTYNNFEVVNEETKGSLA